MLVLVCGMHRSGSTLVWQITRQLLDGRPGLRNPHEISPSEFPIAAADPEDLLLAKIHYRRAVPNRHFPDDGALYLYTYRDVRDVVASLFRKGRWRPGSPERGAEASRQIARRELIGDAFWRRRRTVWIGRYEDIQHDLPGLVRSIAEFLGVVVTPEDVLAIVDWVAVDRQYERVQQRAEQGIDADLRITANRITDGRHGAWRDTLTDDEHDAIEEVAADWLVANGYGVERAPGRHRCAEVSDEGVSAPRSPTIARARKALRRMGAGIRHRLRPHRSGETRESR